jgi:hypothetical protein
MARRSPARRGGLILLAATAFAPAAALGQPMPGMDMPGMDMPGMEAPGHAQAPGPQASPPASAPPQAGDHPVAAPPASTADAAMPGMDVGTGPMPGMAMGEQAHAMSGALGAYPAAREASGTSWQPDASEHAGVHLMRGDWMFMGHALINGVYDWQQGPRGDEKTFVSGMVMGMARRSFADGDALQFRVMLSPDPFMGKSGYPLLLAAGETANGVTPLVDRQHPHDLFMELSASYSHRLSANDSVFLYMGLPGEPAFGPPAFMHRLSIMDSPEAPISHHWLDSTHIVFGVVTAGYVHDDWKLEVSRFKGREPDQHRFDFDAPKLDSTAARLSWNPTRNLALQASWAYAKDVEQLAPGVNQTKWSASAIYTVPIRAHGWWSSTLAWGQRSSEHRALDAAILESAVKLNDAWTVFSRAEWTQNDELLDLGIDHGPSFDVGKVSAGAVHDWRVAEHVKFGLGALYAVNFVPRALKPFYGGDEPKGAMAFVRLKVD